jgi:hypothetical protein
MYERTQQRNGGSTRGTTSSKQPAGLDGQLMMAMAQAQAYYPNQALPKGTPEVYLTAWKETANRYGSDRFAIALWNVLRRSDFFPLPQHIEDECRFLKAQTTISAANMEVWRCESCHTNYGCRKAPVGGCQKCGALTLRQIARREPEFNHAAYMRDVRANPQNYVRVSDVIREWTDSRRKCGLPVNANLVQAILERSGDAA